VAPQPAKKRTSFAKDIRFKVNTDEFDFDQPETAKNLNELLTYMQESCDELQVMVEGHASADGPAQRNKDLSDLRAQKVRQWLLEQGVPPNKVRGAVGYGSAMPRVKEPTPAQAKKMTKDQLEAIRRQNRRIEVAVLRECSV
jgi:OOP family OmpA-OmpF porin